MLTRRGRFLLVLAAGMYIAGWALGAAEAYPAALGMAAAPLLALGYSRLIRGPFRLARRGGPGERIEGQQVTLGVEVIVEAGALPASARLRDTLPGVGLVDVPLTRHEDTLQAMVTLSGLPRGRYRLDHAAVVVQDPFGLAEFQQELEASGALVVYPRISEIERFFPDGGGPDGASGRLLLQRGSGFELHAVREHQPGESLRRVHWPSTAHRQRLMVKEPEDAPRDDAVVLLDARSGLDVGTPPDSSFEMIVRTAGTILRRLVADGRRTSLVISGQRITRYSASSLEGDWRAVLDALAACQGDGARRVAAALSADPHSFDAARLVIVTADVEPTLVARLSAARARREIVLCWVDARTWREAEPAANASDAAAAMLASRSIPVRRIRRGDDLAQRLAPTSRVSSGVGA